MIRNTKTGGKFTCLHGKREEFKYLNTLQVATNLTTKLCEQCLKQIESFMKVHFVFECGILTDLNDLWHSSVSVLFSL